MVKLTYSLNEYELFEKLKNATQNKVLIILEHINSICIMNVCVFASDSIWKKFLFRKYHRHCHRHYHRHPMGHRLDKRELRTHMLSLVFGRW